MEHRFKRLDAYGTWIQEMVRDGWNAYFTNFMFRQISGSPKRRVAIMRDEVERIYSTLLTQIERDPTSPKRLQYLPRFFGCEDRAVYKKSKATKQGVSPNGGSHINGMFLFPWKSRLRKHPIDLIGDNKKYYIPEGGPLLNIHFTPAHHTPEKIVDYTFKAIKRGWVDEEDMIILPKSLSEINK